METLPEIARLKAVYGHYEERRWSQTKWSKANPGNQSIRRERDHQLLRVLRSTGFVPLTSRRLLDVGCGNGDGLAQFLEWGARPENLFGVDLLPDRIRQARAHHPEITFQEANGETLPFADAAFDLILSFTVFTSILDDGMAGHVSREMDRVLRPGGAVVWYDFRMNNPFNRCVRPMARENVTRLFPSYDARLQSITLLPPLARRGRLTGMLYAGLAAWPFLRSHYLGLLIKPPEKFDNIQ